MPLKIHFSEFLWVHYSTYKSQMRALKESTQDTQYTGRGPAILTYTIYRCQCNCRYIGIASVYFLASVKTANAREFLIGCYTRFRSHIYPFYCAVLTALTILTAPCFLRNFMILLTSTGSRYISYRFLFEYINGRLYLRRS